MSAFGVSYAFGDLSVTAGKTSSGADPDAIVSATYTMTVDALTVTAQMDTLHLAITRLTCHTLCLMRLL